MVASWPEGRQSKRRLLILIANTSHACPATPQHAMVVEITYRETSPGGNRCGGKRGCAGVVFVAGASCVLCGCAVSMIQSSKSAIRGELLLVTFDSAKAGCTSQLGALQPQRPPIVGRVVSQQLRSAESMSTNPRVFFQISCANPIARLLRRRSSPVACAAASGRVMLAELSKL